MALHYGRGVFREADRVALVRDREDKRRLAELGWAGSSALVSAMPRDFPRALGAAFAVPASARWAGGPHGLDAQAHEREENG
jgi:hypothetical protein